jgi:hypothetical protein
MSASVMLPASTPSENVYFVARGFCGLEAAGLARFARAWLRRFPTFATQGILGNARALRNH